MKSIRLRLTRKLIGILLLVLLVGLGSTYWSVRSALIREFDNSLRIKALAVSTNTIQSSAGARVQFTHRYMEAFGENLSTDSYELWHADGTVMRRSNVLGDSNLPNVTGSIAQPHYGDLLLANGILSRTIGFVFTPRPASEFQSPESIPELHLVVATNRRPLDNQLNQLKLILIANGLGIIAAIVLLVPGTLRTEFRPIDRMGDQAAQITAEMLEVRFKLNDLPAELEPIGEKLNDLLARLQDSFKRERQFSANLAHELRTPVAELRTWAEYSLKFPDRRSAEGDREVLEIALQMQGIVSRMLTLARGERGGLNAHAETVALQQLFDVIWGPLSTRASQKQLRLQFDLGANEVRSDPVILRSILTNLLENAVQYSPERGDLIVQLTRHGATTTFSVTNSVHDFESNDLDRLFDRFWRKDDARTGGEHAGLGLSLARELARVLSLELTAQMPRPGRLTFTLAGLENALTLS